MKPASSIKANCFPILCIASLCLSSCLFPRLIQAATCAVSPSGLVSWWRAESNAVDSADSNNGALVGNTTHGAGRVGTTFVFDGSSDGVSIGNPTNLQLQNFSIEGWVKRGNAARASQDPYNSGDIFCCTWGGYGLAMHDDGTLLLTKVG